MSLMDFVSEHLGNDQVDHIAHQLGASKEQTENAIGMALPTLLGAVARKADDERDMAQLEQDLGDHDGSVFDDLGATLGQAPASPGIQAFGGGGDLLGNILGGRQGRVEQGLGQASGLNSSQVASLLGMLAPLVMGAIGKKKRADNMDVGGLTGMLRGEKENLERQASGGLLAGLLDQDGDGDFDFQDVMNLGMKHLFGR